METGRIAMMGLLGIGAAVALRAAVTHHATASTPPSPAAAPARAAPPRRPTSFGLNLNYLNSWTNERAFMNLALPGAWHATTSGWPAFDPARITPEGTIRSLKEGENAALPLSFPAASHLHDVRIRCSWEGRGAVSAFNAKDVSTHGQAIEFVFPKDGQVSVLLDRTDPADPVHRIDCREPTANRAARFHPAFLASLKPYTTVRFQGWSSVNTNTGGDWSKRTLPSAQFIGPDGVSVEDMVALANEAHVDPWFTMDWRADATYMANFARYVHQHLDPARTVYVEIGNEVWNWTFLNARLAMEEGRAEKLAPTDDNVARMRRYAEHALEGFAIWNREYGADRGRLVRVLGGQAVWPDFLKLALDYKDTPRQIDAIAMAPYFGYDFFDGNRPTGDTDAMFRGLTAKVDQAIGVMRQDKALADAYGLRLIAYEAGSHLVYKGPDQTVIPRLARDPRMAELYRRYLQGWKHEAGDLMMLFTNVDPVGPSTNWGMVDFYGEPMAQTPKLQALLDEER